MRHESPILTSMNVQIVEVRLSRLGKANVLNNHGQGASGATTITDSIS